MSAPPKTILSVGAAEEADIRAAVCAALGVERLGGVRTPAETGDAAAFAAILRDPAVSAPIYDLPDAGNISAVAQWIEGRVAARARGEGLLLFNRDADGAIDGYSDVAVWPTRASGELAGAMRADRQNAGQGGAGALRTFGWMFETIGLRLICLTAALDNVRSARLIEAAGFVRMGERDAIRADGSVRPSLYWEMTRAQWRAKWGDAAQQSA
ncbi:MAG: GNAT family N-acetyltransferase [Alphaproteobacteria bacterium]|nr:GNAT family N-acetyltransferase [Alphaproteobacteria bacterium]